MDLQNNSDVETALQRVGELLDADGHAYAIVILGGAALNLLGIVQRPTTDVDILAFVRSGRLDRTGERPLPRPSRPRARE